MTITAKKIGPDGSVVDVPLDDDPKDIDLINALGGEGQSDIVTIGWTAYAHGSGSINML